MKKFLSILAVLSLCICSFAYASDTTVANVDNVQRTEVKGVTSQKTIVNSAVVTTNQNVVSYNTNALQDKDLVELVYNPEAEVKQSPNVDNNFNHVWGSEYPCGLNRLANTLTNNSKIEGIEIKKVYKINNEHYLAVVKAPKEHYSTGVWLLNVCPNNDTYRVAPTNGVWFNLYDNEFHLLGVIQGQKLAKNQENNHVLDLVRLRIESENWNKANNTEATAKG